MFQGVLSRDSFRQIKRKARSHKFDSLIKLTIRVIPKGDVHLFGDILRIIEHVMLFLRRISFSCPGWHRFDKDVWVQAAYQIVQGGMDRFFDARQIRDERPVWSERSQSASVEAKCRNCQRVVDSLCRAAHFSIRFFPNMAAISTRASVSSVLVKKGKRRVSMQRSVTPTDHISSAER